MARGYGSRNGSFLQFVAKRRATGEPRGSVLYRVSAETTRVGRVGMKTGKQTTLCVDAAVTGIGVHSGLPATLTLHPADAGTGIVFLRTGLEGRPDREIRADVRSVTATELATELGDPTGPLCSTAEHVLAALSGLGVDNAIVEIDGPEVPSMERSAKPVAGRVAPPG